MADTPLTPEPSPVSRPAVWREFAQAPLVPVAVAVTIGLIVDRYLGIPLEGSLLLGIGGLVAWAVAAKRAASTAPIWLGVAFAGLAAAYHHSHRHSFPPDDIGEIASVEPQLIQLRGIVIEEPIRRHSPRPDPLTPPQKDRDSTILTVTGVADSRGNWRPTSGRVTLTVERDQEPNQSPTLGGIHAGDAVEVVGMLFQPRSPGNPGEQDFANQLLDRRIRAEVRVSDSSATVTRLDGSVDPWASAIASVRNWAAAGLVARLQPSSANVARALLLGDTAAMDRDEWDAFIRTGVVHTLAISGQHLLVLAGFAWIVLKLAGVRRSRGAWVVMVLIVGYAVLTGLRPSGVRAAIMVVAVCGGWVLRRPVHTANSFALSWLVVIALNPTDPFSLGCQLSFLSVFALVWVAGRWFVPGPVDPLDAMTDESRPTWERALRELGRWILTAYAISLLLAAVNAPLLASGVNLVSPIGIVIGPPVVVLTSIALVCGFLIILLHPLGFLATPFAWLTDVSLDVAGWIVQGVSDIPGAAVWTPGPPMWWLVGFYAGLGAAVLMPQEFRTRCLGTLLGWVVLGLLIPMGGGTNGELRVTFLSIGHGGCTVIETPDGRCLVYDAGSITGPATIRRVVAPYLWHRGVTRIDELFLSHADTDHFNGVAELLKRFPVGQVTLTPTFSERPTIEVATALQTFERHRAPVRIAIAGDRFSAGNVTIDVLHPPAKGPAGIENERSLVLMLRHADHTILLTGDLERAGMSRVLGLPPQPCDVLMAPHHGSRGAFPMELIEWSRPKLVVASRGPEKGNSIAAGEAGTIAPIWNTWSGGAITLRSHRSGLIAESYRTGERIVVVRGGK